MDNKVTDLSEFGLSDEELFKTVDHSTLESEKITAPRYSYWKSVFRVFFSRKINVFFLVLLALIIVFAYVYPVVIHYDPNAEYANASQTDTYHLRPKQAIEKLGFSTHWILGTGDYGRSTFDTIWYGSSISISLAFVCAAINMFIGILIGAIWGFSKKVDIFMTELYNIVGNVPYTLLIIVLVRVLSASFWSLVFAMTITGWLGIAYFIRTQVVIIRDREHNLASRCLGTPILRLTFKNILPFMTSVIVTLAATEIPSYISSEVFLSYIGIGLKDMTLGKVIEQTNSYMSVPAYSFEFWSPVIIASIITVVLYVVGQNLGDASDPRTHM